MSELWENNRLFNFLKRWADACTKHSYRPVRTVGSLPEEGAVIIAPNHTNTLMDAMVVVRSRKEITVFGARADIFRNPKAARLLRFVHIVPMVRGRDGARTVLQNRTTFSEVDDVLAHGVPFCIFSEGRHRPKHSLLPIQKGIARIAFASARERQTYVVPAGIEYGDYFRYRSTCTLTYGEPLDVNAFLKEHEGCTEADTYRAFLDEIYRRIASLILFIPDDDNYEATWEALRPHRKSHPVLAALLSPLFVLSAVLCFPMWAVAEFVCYRKLKDPAWRNTVRFLVRLVGTPLLVLLWALLVPGWWKLLAVLLFLPSYSFFYDWLNLLPRRERITT